MELTRLAVLAISGLLMAGGYFASINAYFSGTTQDYILRLDSSPIPMISLLMLGLLFLLAVLRQDVAETEADE
jgi:hypothetical protein